MPCSLSWLTSSSLLITIPFCFLLWGLTRCFSRPPHFYPVFPWLLLTFQGRRGWWVGKLLFLLQLPSPLGGDWLVHLMPGSCQAVDPWARHALSCTNLHELIRMSFHLTGENEINSWICIHPRVYTPRTLRRATLLLFLHASNSLLIQPLLMWFP